MNKKLKIGIIAAAWIVYLLIGLSGQSSEKEGGAENNSDQVTQEETVEEDKLVDDPVVSAFLQDCSFDYGEIQNGNIRTKYFIHINNCYTELLNSNTDELIITINGYHIDEINEAEVLEAFRSVSQVINGNANDEEIEKIINELLNHNTDYYSGEIGDLEYQFSPFVELSQGVSEARIEIRTKKYNE